MASMVLSDAVRGGAVAREYDKFADMEIIEDTNTADVVRQLAAIDLGHNRCHQITEDAPPDVDPFALVKEELAPLSLEVRAQLEAQHESLTDASQHFFGAGNTREGKRVRPVIVLLMGRATQIAGAPEEVLEANADRQRRLAAITEIIHTASLIHDDVLDAADTRRGGLAVHKKHSNQAAVLSGDFLLARASVALAKLRRTQVVREMAKSLEALVQGELMQLKSSEEERLSLEYYLTKSYCKTASLMAYSCKSAALLSDHALDSDVVIAAEKFGYHFGLAFQVIDDLLDFTESSDTLGKPGLQANPHPNPHPNPNPHPHPHPNPNPNPNPNPKQDMALGLSTAPVLYGIADEPDLRELVERKFSKKGDVPAAYELVMKSNGLQKTKELATFHAQAAVDACCALPEGEARDGLVRLCHLVLSRSS